mmetsp:Transcript_24674/g.76773  ORF Transcript_24674/g.76773 Transcript_24674/m.76773 type:complete len:129 (+) Transcript_24674:2-388(+)
MSKLKLMEAAINAFNQAVPGGAAISHFTTHNTKCCVQGQADYLQEKLEQIEASSARSGRRQLVVMNGTCASLGYKQESEGMVCVPKATLHTKLFLPITNIWEPTVIAACDLTGMAKLCNLAGHRLWRL